MTERIRQLARVIKAQATLEGAGVRLRRTLGSQRYTLDPFLLLDEFKSKDPADYLPGFPSHPHRGIETVTYVLHGEVNHKDSTGNAGTIGAGQIQWMSAGRGIIHSEMPTSEDGFLWGLQLWVNLPASKKMTPPRYQQFGADQIPLLKRDDGTVIRVIAGELAGARGPVRDIDASPTYLDVSVPPGASFSIPVPPLDHVFAYVLEGQLQSSTEGRAAAMGEGQLIAFGEGDRILLQTKADPARFLLVSGRPLNEPVVWYGPFVMNTDEEIEQALRDYQNGTLAR